MMRNQVVNEVLFLLEQMLESHMKDCHQELEKSGFYDVDDFDAPSTPEQDMLLAKQEAYEEMLIEVLHMQGKRYYMEIVADYICKTYKDTDAELIKNRKINLTYLFPAYSQRIKS